MRVCVPASHCNAIDTHDDVPEQCYVHLHIEKILIIFIASKYFIPMTFTRHTVQKSRHLFAMNN